jgi:hypothetical protein
MHSNAARWSLLLPLVILAALAVTFWQSSGTVVVTAAPGDEPLAQATATPTATATATRTATPTRNPNNAVEQVQGSRPIQQEYIANGDGSDSASFYCRNCTPVTAASYPTPLPTWTPQPNIFSGTPVPVRGQQVASVATIIRPTGTPSPYPTLGAINQSATTPVALTFANICRVQGGSATVTMLRMLTDQSSNTARYRLHLYNVAPTPLADTASYTSLYTNASIRIGYIDVYALQTEGSGSTAANSLNSDIRLPVICGPGDTNLYGQLETIDAFTGASGQQFYISLTASQD